MKTVIAFVCTHNSCRSIIAEGLMKHLASDIFDIYSAGTEKYPTPKPLAIEVMEDIGIDMSYATSKLLDSIPEKLDILITMGCGVDCPYIPTKYREDWELDDPSGGPKSNFVITRDLIEQKIIKLINEVKKGTLYK